MFISQDTSWFTQINENALTYSNWNSVMIFFAEKLIYVLIGVLILNWIISGNKTKKMILQALLSTGFALVTGSIISYFVPRDRPFVTLNVHQLIEHAAENSFPSQHSLIMFSLATMVFLHHKGKGLFWLMLAALVGFARVWCGVHFPGDIIGGAILGILSSWVVKTYLPAWSVVGIFLTYLLKMYNYLEYKIISLAQK